MAFFKFLTEKVGLFSKDRNGYNNLGYLNEETYYCKFNGLVTKEKNGYNNLGYLNKGTSKNWFRDEIRGSHNIPVDDRPLGGN